MRNNEERFGAVSEIQDATPPQQFIGQSGEQSLGLSFVIPTEFVNLPSKGKFYPPTHPLYKKDVIEWCVTNNVNICDKGFTEPPKAMPDEYKVKSVVESYRNYYMGAKSGFAVWKNIAEELGVTTQTVSNLHKKGISLLKRKIKNRKLEIYE